MSPLSLYKTTVSQACQKYETAMLKANELISIGTHFDKKFEELTGKKSTVIKEIEDCKAAYNLELIQSLKKAFSAYSGSVYLSDLLLALLPQLNIYDLSEFYELSENILKNGHKLFLANIKRLKVNVPSINYQMEKSITIEDRDLNYKSFYSFNQGSQIVQLLLIMSNMIKDLYTPETLLFLSSNCESLKEYIATAKGVDPRPHFATIFNKTLEKVNCRIKAHVFKNGNTRIEFETINQLNLFKQLLYK